MKTVAGFVDFYNFAEYIRRAESKKELGGESRGGKGPVKNQNLHYGCNANAGRNDLIVSF